MKNLPNFSASFLSSPRRRGPPSFVENMNNSYYAYILTNRYHTTFYTGVTNNLYRRLIEHKIKINEGFTNDYNVNQLVHYELFFNIGDAIAREKRLKRWNRQWKINLIEKTNAGWADLAKSIGVTEAVLIRAKTAICSNRKRRSPTRSGKTISRSCKTR